MPTGVAGRSCAGRAVARAQTGIVDEEWGYRPLDGPTRHARIQFPTMPFSNHVQCFHTMNESEATRILQNGVAILNDVLAAHGFNISSRTEGISSGGSYASCQFSRRNRKLRLHFRHSLGLVEYDVNGVILSHEEYMWSVLGRRGGTSYPGFSNEPLDGFRHLADDLRQYAQNIPRR
jgi:hypothetical protein